jgi:arylsulfatase A-like enzyme
MYKYIIRIALAALSFGVCGLSHASSSKPNIVYILADDLGYGDVQVLNPKRGKIATPHMDQLAQQGMIFTDAHTSSSVCTPTRYGIITGRYNWRSRLQSGVLFGFDQPLIPTERTTVASFMKAQGYHTAAIGKWHLGMGMRTVNGKPTNGKVAQVDQVDWKARIEGGPTDLGFDYYYGIAASLDMPPYIYIENDRFVGEATTVKEFHPNRKGPAEPSFEAVDVLPEIGRKSVEYIQQQKADQPFFMYIALTSPHTPIVPSQEWEGQSSLGVYGDFVMQTDAVVGQIVAAIDRAGLTEDTIVIFTSDNGCSARPAKASQLEKAGHYPSAQYRGYKSDLWEGGHRVPFIVRWPAGIEAGSFSDQTICLTDLMATCAELTGAQLPETAGEDSVSFASAFQGKEIVSSRAGVIHHSISGRFAYREGKWKLLLTRGSGGWSKVPRSEKASVQLYDMEADPGETKNLYKSHPEVVARLLAQLEADVKRGRSTDGAEQSNDVNQVNFMKGAKL